MVCLGGMKHRYDHNLHNHLKNVPCIGNCNWMHRVKTQFPSSAHAAVHHWIQKSGQCTWLHNLWQLLSSLSNPWQLPAQGKTHQLAHLPWAQPPLICHHSAQFLFIFLLRVNESSNPFVTRRQPPQTKSLRREGGEGSHHNKQGAFGVGRNNQQINQCSFPITIKMHFIL